MALKREAFVSTRLEEERERADIISVRLSAEERAYLEALKLWYNETNDSTALKKQAFKDLKLVDIYRNLGRR